MLLSKNRLGPDANTRHRGLFSYLKSGAGKGSRTLDLRFTKHLLYLELCCSGAPQLAFYSWATLFGSSSTLESFAVRDHLVTIFTYIPASFLPRALAAASCAPGIR